MMSPDVYKIDAKQVCIPTPGWYKVVDGMVFLQASASRGRSSTVTFIDTGGIVFVAEGFYLHAVSESRIVSVGPPEDAKEYISMLYDVIVALASDSAEDRISSVLAKLSRSNWGEATGLSKITHTLIGDLAHCSRETVCRTLQNWR